MLKEMVKNIAYALCLALLFTACNNKNEACPYQISTSCISLDKNLYVSYEINSVKYTYYLGEPGGGGGSAGWATSAVDGKYAVCKAFYCGFNDYLPEITDNLMHECGFFNLTFFTYEVVNGSTTPILNTSQPHNVLKSKEYKFTCAKNSVINSPLADTLFVNGVSMKSGQYSTLNIMKYYKFDYDKIYSDILNTSNSFFKITSIEPVCNGYYMIKGEFATKLMNEEEPQDILEVKNGKFQFLIY